MILQRCVEGGARFTSAIESCLEKTVAMKWYFSENLHRNKTNDPKTFRIGTIGLHS